MTCFPSCRSYWGWFLTQHFFHTLAHWLPFIHHAVFFLLQKYFFPVQIQSHILVCIVADDKKENIPHLAQFPSTLWSEVWPLLNYFQLESRLVFLTGSHAECRCVNMRPCASQCLTNASRHYCAFLPFSSAFQPHCTFICTCPQTHAPPNETWQVWMIITPQFRGKAGKQQGSLKWLSHLPHPTFCLTGPQSAWLTWLR